MNVYTYQHPICLYQTGAGGGGGCVEWECGWAAGGVQEERGREALLLWLETTCCASRWNSPDPFRIQINTFPPSHSSPTPLPPLAHPGCTSLLFYFGQLKCLSARQRFRFRFRCCQRCGWRWRRCCCCCSISFGTSTSVKPAPNPNIRIGIWRGWGRGEGGKGVAGSTHHNAGPPTRRTSWSPTQNSNALQQIRLYSYGMIYFLSIIIPWI